MLGTRVPSLSRSLLFRVTFCKIIFFIFSFKTCKATYREETLLRQVHVLKVSEPSHTAIEIVVAGKVDEGKRPLFDRNDKDINAPMRQTIQLADAHVLMLRRILDNDEMMRQELHLLELAD